MKSKHLLFAPAFAAMMLCTLPVSAHAQLSCGCASGTSQTAPGPGGCTLKRSCIPGNCHEVDVDSEPDEDGVVTTTTHNGTMGPWKEVCKKRLGEMSEAIIWLLEDF